MTKKLILFVAVVAMLGALAAACAQAPVIVYIVVTATPEGSTVVSTPNPTATTESAVIPPTATAQPTAEATRDPSITAEPTVTVRQILVAEQPFQRGRMFWLEPTGQIWVMVETEPGVGFWQVYEDLFREGGIESDDSLIPPPGLFQPIRGFGLIWRSDDELRNQLGWATDIEVGFVSNYEYHPGDGTTPENFVPGYHFMQNQYGDWYRFNEINQTWQSVTYEGTQPTPTLNAPSS